MINPREELRKLIKNFEEELWESWRADKARIECQSMLQKAYTDRLTPYELSEDDTDYDVLIGSFSLEKDVIEKTLQDAERFTGFSRDILLAGSQYWYPEVQGNHGDPDFDLGKEAIEAMDESDQWKDDLRHILFTLRGCICKHGQLHQLSSQGGWEKGDLTEHLSFFFGMNDEEIREFRLEHCHDKATEALPGYVSVIERQQRIWDKQKEEEKERESLKNLQERYNAALR